MNIKELIQKLQMYPEETEIWISDRGYVEGGEKLSKISYGLAGDFPLDGDDIDDEYFYIDDMKESEVKEKLNNGYFKLKDNPDMISKKIIYLNDL